MNYHQPVLENVGDFVSVGLICQRLPNGTPACNIPQLVHHHSPTGFEWGYPGSGPADLALNVLHLLLPPSTSEDTETLHDQSLVSARAMRLHQRFKSKFLTTMPQQGGRLPLQEMQDWISQQDNPAA